MQIVDIIPREICVMLELSEAECAHILDFLNKAVPLYSKVHSNSVTDDSLSIAEDFMQTLTSVSKMLKKETGNDS